MSKGTVKWFDSEKGFGFIEQESGEDLFVHHSEVRGEPLKDGQTVEYDEGHGKKGPCAVNVTAS